MSVCNCYLITCNCNGQELLYTNCDGLLVSQSLNNGETINICSIDTPIISNLSRLCPEPIPPLLISECIDGNCLSLPETCYCYEVFANCDNTLVYIDCDGNYTSTEYTMGTNLEICSKIQPQFINPCLAQSIQLLGICVVNSEFLTCSTFSEICNCYEVIATCDIVVQYVNCDGSLINLSVLDGETISVCSLIEPQILVPSNCINLISPTLIGECIDNICTTLPTTTTTTTIPTTTTTTTISQPRPDVPIQPKNECDPITIFPMGVECFTIQPTFADSYDGVVGLGITGGTPPFTIKWDDGSIAPAKFNLNAGEYTATVVDYYGDFTATTTCVLTGVTTTTTTIPETTTQKVYSDYCLIITTTNRSSKIVTTQTSLTQFTYGGSYNGYPSWVSSSPSGLIYWSGGTTNSWIVSGSSSNQFLINNSYTNPNTGEPLPLTNWQLIGTPNPSIQLQSILFTEGTCSSVNTPSFTIDKNDPTCGCDGSITIQANGGTPPYEYSVNGGTTFQQTPIFQNLCGGNYSVYVKDSLGVTSNQQVNLTPSPSPTTYTLALTVTSNTFNINVTPPLPLGTTISLDLQHVSTFTKQPASSPQTYNNVVTVLKNSIPVPSTGSPNVVPTNLTVTGPCSVFGRLKTETTTNWQNIIISSGDIINGTYTNSLSVLTPPFPTCYIPANKFSKILITNISSISGCECCNFVFTNPSYETSGNSAFL